MSDNLKQEIRDFWLNASLVETDSEGLRPTARDPHLQDLVESAIELYIKPDMHVLDVGCGDGQSTLRFAKLCKSVTGVDYIPNYVARAEEAAQTMGILNASWEVADATLLTQSLRGEFDAVVMIRCLINLGSWEAQKRALEQAVDVLRPGGLLILSEGWQEGWDGLNRIRSSLSMTPIDLVPYNRLISLKYLQTVLRGKCEFFAHNSLAFYILLSRVVQPAFVSPSKPRHDHMINKIAADLSIHGVTLSDEPDCDYAGVWVFRKVA